MRNTFGNAVSLTLFGESHGAYIGAVLDGLSAGVPVSEEEIARQLTRRRPSSLLDTARAESDRFEIVSGVFNGKTTGTPICILIPNENTRSADYDYGRARPSHADFAAYKKYHGFEDYRGGGHFSGRVTAALVAMGGILLPALKTLGITLGTHISLCQGHKDASFQDAEKDLAFLQEATFPVLDQEVGEKMKQKILAARAEGDSVGGATESLIHGLPAGLGEPWFDSLEGLLSHALFSIGGIKGISFGAGFDFAAMKGSEANDAWRMKDGKPFTETNNNGGINGGISNGMDIVFSCAVKPTPSIAKEQETVNFITNEETTLAIKGRHDPAIIRRICPVIDSVTALVLCDVLTGRYGSDVFTKGLSLCVTD
ncbi:MAG: chorismate synthase [Clostridia bacterium]|nr:chorismate synthase [Clostridia bacterium]